MEGVRREGALLVDKQKIRHFLSSVIITENLKVFVFVVHSEEVTFND